MEEYSRRHIGEYTAFQRRLAGRGFCRFEREGLSFPTSLSRKATAWLEAVYRKRLSVTASSSSVHRLLPLAN
jgi:hypothetical protein